MKAHNCAFALCLYTAFAAEAPITVGDLVGRVTEALAVDRDDERMAHALASAVLKERLSDGVIAKLQRMGAGPLTLRELQALGRQSAALPRPALSPLALKPTPTASECAAMALAVRNYTAGYLDSLPDFTCTREDQRFRTPTGRQARLVEKGLLRSWDWVHDGSNVTEVSWVGHREHYRLVSIDGKPTGESFAKIENRVSWGETAGLLNEIPDIGPELRWDHWEVTDNWPAAVLTYFIPLADSQYTLCCPRFLAAHRGLVYADPQSGAVLRLIIYANGLTRASPAMGSGNVVDYGDVVISGKHYLLPRRSVAWVLDHNGEGREEIVYRDYRKFDANATITFPEEKAPAQKRQ